MGGVSAYGVDTIFLGAITAFLFVIMISVLGILQSLNELANRAKKVPKIIKLFYVNS